VSENPRTAFQKSAFQNNAFQIFGPVSGGMGDEGGQSALGTFPSKERFLKYQAKKKKKLKRALQLYERVKERANEAETEQVLALLHEITPAANDNNLPPIPELDIAALFAASDLLEALYREMLRILQERERIRELLWAEEEFLMMLILLDEATDEEFI
jgi:hypothetical protein